MTFSVDISKQYYISAFEPKDEHRVFVAMNDPENSQNLVAIPSPYTLEHAKDWVNNKSQDKYKDGKTPLIFAIRDRLKVLSSPNDSDLIGSIGVRPSDVVSDLEKFLPDDADTTTPFAIFGFWLLPEYRRQGLMTAAINTVIDKILIEIMGIHRFYGNYLGHNMASKGVFTKAGFKYVGLKPQFAEKLSAPGQKFDLGIMELTR